MAAMFEILEALETPASKRNEHCAVLDAQFNTSGLGGFLERGIEHDDGIFADIEPRMIRHLFSSPPTA